MLAFKWLGIVMCSRELEKETERHDEVLYSTQLLIQDEGVDLLTLTQF